VVVLSHTLGILYLDPYTGADQAAPLLAGFTAGTSSLPSNYDSFFGGVYLSQFAKNLFMVTYPEAYGGNGAIVFIDESTMTVVKEVRGEKAKHDPPCNQLKEKTPRQWESSRSVPSRRSSRKQGHLLCHGQSDERYLLSLRPDRELEIISSSESNSIRY